MESLKTRMVDALTLFIVKDCENETDSQRSQVLSKLLKEELNTKDLKILYEEDDLDLNITHQDDNFQLRCQVSTRDKTLSLFQEVQTDDIITGTTVFYNQKNDEFLRLNHKTTITVQPLKGELESIAKDRNTRLENQETREVEDV